jgi:hypothetical protein
MEHTSLSWTCTLEDICATYNISQLCDQEDHNECREGAPCEDTVSLNLDIMMKVEHT